MAEDEVGKVSSYFARVSVAGIELTGTLRSGDTIHIKGHTTDFQQAVESMEIEHVRVQEAGPGQSIGIKVSERCRQGDHVYKVVP